MGSPGQFLGSPFTTFANTGVVTDRASTVIIQEYLDKFTGARFHPPIVKGKFLRMTIIADFFEPPGQFAESLVPANPFPLSFAPFTDSLHRIKNAIRIIDLVNPSLSLRAHCAFGANGIRLWFHLNQPAILYITNRGTTCHTLPASCWNRFSFGSGFRRKVHAAPDFGSVCRLQRRYAGN